MTRTGRNAATIGELVLKSLLCTRNTMGSGDRPPPAQICGEDELEGIAHDDRPWWF